MKTADDVIKKMKQRKEVSPQLDRKLDELMEDSIQQYTIDRKKK